MTKPKILFFAIMVTAETKALAKSIGAEFRNPKFVNAEKPEPCDFVLAEDDDLIPECYAETERFDEDAYAAQLFQLQSKDNFEVPDGEITVEYLEALEKPELLALATAKEVELTKSVKRSPKKIRETLAEALIQE